LRYYTYFPGCSASEGGAKAYNRSAQAVSKLLEVELAELEDWNCCGSTPSGSVDELGAYCMAARDLALAEKRGLDMVTPCSACYVIFNRTNTYLNGYPHFMAKVNEALAAGGLEYDGKVKVRHMLDVITTDVGYEAVKAKVNRPLNGLKVASYYGCQVVRPSFGFDHPEYPQSLDNLVTSLGAEAVPFPLKTRCCGGSLVISEEDVALDLLHKLLESASSHGAECLVTVCPLCQTNLDVYQARVNRKFKTHYKLPVLFFTQLMGIAFGLEEKDLGLKTGVVPVNKALAKYV
jgi:heterodisulfide reductase subunit B